MTDGDEEWVVMIGMGMTGMVRDEVMLTMVMDNCDDDYMEMTMW